MLDKYRDWLLVNGNSFNTAKNYCWRLDRVLAQIPEESLSKEGIEAFLLKLQGKGMASTFNGYLSAINSYLTFIGKKIELPSALKEPRTLPESFDEKYLDNTIIPTIAQLFANDYLKFKALFYFFFYGGIRVSEVDRLQRKDFDLVKRQAKIYMQKTKEERIVFYNEKTKQALEEYFSYELEETNAFNIKSQIIKLRIHLIKSYFSEINLHIHLFRHSFAVDRLRKGADLLTVSKLLGHRNINSTMRYLGLTTSQMQEIYDKCDRKIK